MGFPEQYRKGLGTGTPLAEVQLNNMAQEVSPEEFEQKKIEQGNIKESRENMPSPSAYNLVRNRVVGAFQ
jgi:hypothetical protein